MRSVFSNEIKSFQTIFNNKKSEIREEFNTIQDKYNDLARSGLGHKDIISTMRRNEDFARITSENHSLTGLEARITEASIVGVLGGTKSYDDIIIELSHHILRNNEFTGLFAGNDDALLKNKFRELIISEHSNDMDRKIDAVWKQSKIWPLYTQKLQYACAVNDEAMKEVSNILLKANLAAANYDEVEQREEPFKINKDEYSYTLFALGQGMHWVPLIKDKKLQKKWYRSQSAFTFNLKKYNKYYDGKGLSGPIFTKLGKIIRKIGFFRANFHSPKIQEKIEAIDLNKLTEKLQKFSGVELYKIYNSKRKIHWVKKRIYRSYGRKELVDNIQLRINTLLDDPIEENVDKLSQAISDTLKVIGKENNIFTSELEKIAILISVDINNYSRYKNKSFQKR